MPLYFLSVSALQIQTHMVQDFVSSNIILKNVGILIFK